MTDKELMEESLRGYCLECNPKCDNLTTRLSGYKDGFFAGLEAGRPQWHYPSEGDLPKKIK